MSRALVIGAVIAMDVELRHLLAEGDAIREQKIGPWPVAECSIGEHHVIAILSGIGMVNAAAATEFLIDRFHPAIIVNSGCTGAHVAALLPGDVVIGTEVVHPAALQILANGDERHMGFAFDTIGGSVKSPSLPSDQQLLALARQIAPTVSLPAWPGQLDWPVQIPRREPHIVAGAVASADIWTQQIARIDELHARHGTLCEDMEAAAIAQIAARHEIRYLTIKDISNNERFGQTDLVGDLAGFPMEEAGRRAAILLARCIAAIPPGA